MPEFKFKTAREMLKQLASLNFFSPIKKGGEVPIHLNIIYYDSPVIVVVGENASGKSFVRRVMSGMLKVAGHEAMHLSMEGRFDYNGNLGAMRSMLYGNEQDTATGATSARLIVDSMRNCGNRGGSSHTIIWDEPELGLSEGAQMGVGAELARGLPKLPKSTVAAVLITHSKPIVRALVNLNPNFVHVGVNQVGIEGWLARAATLRTLADIQEEGHRRRQLIQAVLDKNKKAHLHRERDER